MSTELRREGGATTERLWQRPVTHKVAPPLKHPLLYGLFDCIEEDLTLEIENSCLQCLLGIKSREIQRSRPLVVRRENAASKCFNIGFTLESRRLLPGYRVCGLLMLCHCLCVKATNQH